MGSGTYCDTTRSDPSSPSQGGNEPRVEDWPLRLLSALVADGRELSFLSGPTGAAAVKMMAAPVKMRSSFEAGPPKPMFDANVLYGIGLRQGVRDVAPDGPFSHQRARASRRE